MAQTRSPVTSPDDVARSLLELRDELDQAVAALGVARPLPPVTRARQHLRSATTLADTALSGIVTSWLRATGESARVEGALLAERWAA